MADKSTTPSPGDKYFKGRVIQGQQVLRYVVWNGIRNYQNAPPLDAIKASENMQGTQVHVRVDGNAVEDIEVLIAAPLQHPNVGGLVVWARDHQTYLSIVQRLTQPGCTWLT
jgi:hypothetical protein